MKTTRKTALLGVAALALLGLNLLDRGTGQRLSEALPLLPGLSRDEARRIEISTATDKVVLEARAIEGAGDGAGEERFRWHLVAPVQGDADQVAVRSLLANFRKDVPLDVKVDEGSYDEYGLDATNGVVVEIWGDDGDAEPEVSFTLGQDAPGGSSFLRLSGSEAVYRARVGGRHRYARAPGDWRNRVLLDFDKEDAVGLRVEQGGQETLNLVRGPGMGMDDAGEPLPGDWQLDPDPGWAVDQLAVEALARNLGHMRAGELLGPDFDGGFDPPAATIEVVLDDGATRAIEVGSRAVQGAAFVRMKGQPEVYRVAGSIIAQATQPRAELRDKTMFAFAREDVDTLTLDEGSTSIILQQDLSNGLWSVIQPDNVDLDVKLIFFAVNTMATLRADDVASVSPAQAGLADPATRIRARLLDGSEAVLEIGGTTRDAQGRLHHYARVVGKPQVFLLREQVVSRLKQGFGRT